MPVHRRWSSLCIAAADIERGRGRNPLPRLAGRYWAGSRPQTRFLGSPADIRLGSRPQTRFLGSPADIGRGRGRKPASSARRPILGGVEAANPLPRLAGRYWAGSRPQNRFLGSPADIGRGRGRKPLRRLAGRRPPPLASLEFVVLLRVGRELVAEIGVGDRDQALGAFAEALTEQLGHAEFRDYSSDV